MKNNVDVSLLSRLGIHEQGIEIYLSLLESGPAFVTDLGKTTGMERAIIYRRLPELLSGGIVEREIAGKRFRYVAAHPNVFQNLLKTMDEGLTDTISGLELLFRRKTGASVPKVRVLSGPDASVRLYTEVVETLPKGGIYFRYSSRSEPRSRMGDLKKYHQIRDEKMIERMVITNEDLAKIASEKPDRELVALPGNFPFKQNFQKIIYADRVALFDLETDTAFIIESKLLASFEEAIFRCLFNYLRATKEGRS